MLRTLAGGLARRGVSAPAPHAVRGFAAAASDDGPSFEVEVSVCVLAGLPQDTGQHPALARVVTGEASAALVWGVRNASKGTRFALVARFGWRRRGGDDRWAPLSGGGEL